MRTIENSAKATIIPAGAPKAYHAEGTNVKNRADTAFMPGGKGGGAFAIVPIGRTAKQVQKAFQ